VKIFLFVTFGDRLMDEEIIKEKTSADHLMFVSLKYTKTCDVIMNLLARWKSLIERCFDAILQKGFDDGEIDAMHATPKQRIEFIKKYFVSNKAIQDVVPLYIFFKRIPDLKTDRSGEFRKNVTLRVNLPRKHVDINMDKLHEYYDTVEIFSGEVKKILG
jgi:hypothetical protein